MISGPNQELDKFCIYNSSNQTKRYVTFLFNFMYLAVMLKTYFQNDCASEIVFP